MNLNVPDIDDHAQLAANREEMIVELRARLNVFENRYELASASLRAARDPPSPGALLEMGTWRRCTWTG